MKVVTKIIHNQGKKGTVPVVGSKGSTPFSTKFPRDDRTSDDLVSIQNNHPIHILCIFTVLKPVKNSYRFVNCWVPYFNPKKKKDLKPEYI